MPIRIDPDALYSPEDAEPILRKKPSTQAKDRCLGNGPPFVKLGKNAVKTKNIKNGAVKESKLAGNAVTESKIASGAVTEGKIASGAVTEGKIASGAVSQGKLSASAKALP